MVRAEYLEPDYNAGQAYDDGACACGDLKKSFVLTVDGAGQGGEAVGNGQADDLHGSLVFGQRGDKCLIVPCRPEKKAGSGIQVEIEERLTDQDCG